MYLQRFLSNISDVLGSFYFAIRSCPVDAVDEAMQEPADSSHDICEGAAFIPYETPKDICIDFVADELEKIIADLSVMNADMTDDEHADAMAALLLLRDEAR